jgi:hypothetical protein
MDLYYLQPVISEFQLAHRAVVGIWMQSGAVADFMDEYGIGAEAFEKEYAHQLVRDLVPMVSRSFECHEWPACVEFLEAMHARGVRHHDLHRIFAVLKGIYIGMIRAEHDHLTIHPIFNHDKIIIELHRVFDHFFQEVLKFYAEKAYPGSVSSSE